MFGFHWEYLVIRWGGNVGGPYSDKSEALSYYNSCKGSSIYRRLTWKPRNSWRWKLIGYRSWPGKEDPPWWSDHALLKAGWFT